MNKEKLTNEEINKKLIKLVEENPTLPIVFFVYNEDICFDYSSTFMKSISVEKGVIYESEVNEYIYTSEDDYYEELRDYYSDDTEFANLSDAEYKKEIQKRVDKATHYEAIIVYIRS